MQTTNKPLESQELRKLLIAVETLAIRPAQCTENTLGEALGYFARLVNERTEGVFQIKVIVNTEEFEGATHEKS